MRQRRTPRTLFFGAWRVRALLFILVCLVTVRTVQAQAAGSSEVYPEYQVKAAFLFNFAKFVEWPGESLPEATAPITICVFGKDPFEGALVDTIRGRTVGGRPLIARHVGSDAGFADCQVLFVPATEEERLPGVLDAVARLPVLTVGETEQFARLGGIVRFTLEDNRVRFIVNAGSAKRAGLKLSAKVLSIAKAVIGRDEAVR